MEGLNFDVWYTILDLLEHDDICNLSLVSKYFSHVTGMKLLNAIYLDNLELDDPKFPNHSCLTCYIESSSRLQACVK